MTGSDVEVYMVLAEGLVSTEQDGQNLENGMNLGPTVIFKGRVT